MILDNVVNRILEISQPISIFLYGSRSRDDFLDDSDYEIGALYTKENFIDETSVRNRLCLKGDYRVYPYDLDAFLSNDFDLPFETTIFMRIISTTGKTIWGKKVIENMIPPDITTVSLIRDIKFQLGRASDAFTFKKQGNERISAELFFKSCLIGTRDLIILRIHKFPASYKEMLAFSKNIPLCEYEGIVDRAFNARLYKTVDMQDLLLNVWYLNKFVEHQIIFSYKKFGDCIINVV